MMAFIVMIHLVLAFGGPFATAASGMRLKANPCHFIQIISQVVSFRNVLSFPNGKGFVIFSTIFEKCNCKQKFVNKNLTVTTNSFTDEDIKDIEIYIKLLNLFQLSRIYNLLHQQ